MTSSRPFAVFKAARCPSAPSNGICGKWNALFSNGNSQWKFSDFFCKWKTPWIPVTTSDGRLLSSPQLKVRSLHKGRVRYLSSGWKNEEKSVHVCWSELTWSDPPGSQGESTKDGPLVHGPPPWVQSMDRVHQNIDRVQGPPIFLTPKNTAENNKKIKEVNWKKIIHSNISNDNGNWTEWSSIWSEIIGAILKWIRTSAQGKLDLESHVVTIRCI